MNLKEMVYYAYLEATGKYVELETTNPKYLKMVQIANLMMNQWENEPAVEWRSRKKFIKIGSVDSEKDLYKLPERVLKIDRTSGRNITLKKDDKIVGEIEISDIKVMGNTLDLSGVITDQILDADIYVPIIEKLPKVENPEDPILIDNPYWLVFMTAAEFVRNSQTKNAQYGNIVAYAQSLMESMKAVNNEKGRGEMENAKIGGIF
nr:MAG TPA: hypothetical protein [Caudoviricetes sp.]